MNQTTRLMLYHAQHRLVRHAIHAHVLVARAEVAWVEVAWVEVRGVARVAVQVVFEAEVARLAGAEVGEVPSAECPLGRWWNPTVMSG